MKSRLSAFAARGFAMAGAFIQVVVISRALDLNDAGIVFLLFTLMNLAATVGRFGTDNLVLRRIASGQRGHVSEVRWLASTCLIASIVAGGVLFGLLCLNVMPLPASADALLEAGCVGLMTVFYALNVFAGAVLRGSGRLVAGILAEMGIAPWLTIIFVVVLLQLSTANVATVLLALLAAGAATTLWSVQAASRAVSNPGGGMDWSGAQRFVREHLSSLASLMGTSLLFFALVWVPQIGLGLVGTGAQVAQYTAAARIASFISIFPGIQTSYLAPRFAELAYAGKTSALSSESGRSALSAMLVAVPLVVTVSALPHMVLGLFGEGYEAAAAPALILSVGAYLTLAFGQVNTVMLTAGLERSALVLGALLLVSVASTTVLAAPALGVVGIAVVSATGSVLYSGASAFLIRSRIGVNPTLGFYFQRAFFAAPSTSTAKSG